jgi:hypothetical protein
MELIRVQPQSPELTAVISLHKRDRATLGILPCAGFEQRAASGTLLGCRDGDQLVGYALYDLPSDFVALRQLCVARTHRGRGEIWKTDGPATGLGRVHFDAYFAGARTAVAISITDMRPLREPVPLSVIRRRWPRFHPPQSFRYLTAQEVAKLLECASSAARDLADSRAKRLVAALSA